MNGSFGDDFYEDLCEALSLDLLFLHMDINYSNTICLKDCICSIVLVLSIVKNQLAVFMGVYFWAVIGLFVYSSVNTTLS